MSGQYSRNGGDKFRAVILWCGEHQDTWVRCQTDIVGSELLRREYDRNRFRTRVALDLATEIQMNIARVWLQADDDEVRKLAVYRIQSGLRIAECDHVKSSLAKSGSVSAADVVAWFEEKNGRRHWFNEQGAEKS